MKAVNGGVEECFVNEKRIESEIRNLAVTVARFGKQTDQWLAATHAVNSAVKVSHHLYDESSVLFCLVCLLMIDLCVCFGDKEIGDFENWMKTMEFDCKKITAAIRNIHEDHQ